MNNRIKVPTQQMRNTKYNQKTLFVKAHVFPKPVACLHTIAQEAHPITVFSNIPYLSYISSLSLFTLL